MDDFMKFINYLVTQKAPFHLEITYCNICGWSICVYKAGCASDYPECKSENGNVICVACNDAEMEYAFARAQIELKDWLLEYDGGY